MSASPTITTSAGAVASRFAPKATFGVHDSGIQRQINRPASAAGAQITNLHVSSRRGQPSAKRRASIGSIRNAPSRILAADRSRLQRMIGGRRREPCASENAYAEIIRPRVPQWGHRGDANGEGLGGFASVVAASNARSKPARHSEANGGRADDEKSDSASHQSATSSSRGDIFRRWREIASARIEGGDHGGIFVTAMSQPGENRLPLLRGMASRGKKSHGTAGLRM